jgi:putative peptidoglycan lipid II flippase
MLERHSEPAKAETDSHAGARSALTLSVLTGISPLTGFLCEMVLAWRFGASAITDGYRVAYLLVGFGWMVFIARVLPNVVVPIHAELKAQGKEKDTWRVSFAIANLTIIFTGILSLLIFLWPDRLAQLLGPGLQGQAHTTELLLVRWFVVAYVPLVWSGIAVGILYTQGTFWIPTVASSLGNLAMLGFVGILGGRWGAWSLIAGTLAASLVTLSMCVARLAPLMACVGARCILTLYPRDVSLLPAFALVVPLAVSALIAQLCGVITSRVLSPLPIGTVAIYGYAWKMGILATVLPLSLSTVLFPRFAEAWNGSDTTAFANVCTRAMRTTLFLAVPMTGILYILRTPLVAAMFYRGAFSAYAVTKVAGLFGYMMLLGGVASALITCIQKYYVRLGPCGYRPTVSSVA